MFVQHVKGYVQKWRMARQARRVTFQRAEQRVRRGAAYLDDVDPGWFRRVAADTLELAGGRACVLGQLHGDFRVGLVRARLLTLSSAPRANLAPASFGFQCLPGLGAALQEKDYEHLNRAWQAVIRRRQQDDDHRQTPRRARPATHAAQVKTRRVPAPA